jgi:N-acetylglucosaminyldiphosphoundecaprenol N-acetyl-beta-D-mannosaminyltransferase
MESYFNIRYEFDKEQVHSAIAARLSCDGSDYICVADGVILDNANRKSSYRKVINDGMFSVCDSSYVPLYIKWIYGIRHDQYSGWQIFGDVVSSRKYRMAFVGASQAVLTGLKNNLLKINPDVDDMLFYELPFQTVDEFDYQSIAKVIEDDGADVVWVALGAPKQEYFMARLKPYLRRGVMIGVGAVFKFYSGVDVARAPQWMIDRHLEFVYRLYTEPRKQFKRCMWITVTLPWLLIRELYRKSKFDNHRPNAMDPKVADMLSRR